MTLLGLKPAGAAGSGSRRVVPLLALGDGIEQFVESCCWPRCGNARKLRRRKSVGGAERDIFPENSLSDASLRRLRRADYHSQQRPPRHLLDTGYRFTLN